MRAPLLCCLLAGTAHASSAVTGVVTSVVPVSVVVVVGSTDGSGCSTHPMHIGGGRQLPFGHVKFTIAHHGSTGPGGEALGNPMGVVLTIGGRTIYHAGDTGLFLDMKLIGEQYGPLDVCLLPIGDNFTMGVDDAVKASEYLGGKVTIPMHYDTFELIEADAGAFVRRVDAAGGRGVIVEPGGVFDIA